MSGQVIAIVKDRYWGFPWYWPKVVVLDGGFFCNIVLEEGRDYLVSGWRGRYGVVEVAGCSRTQPLSTAQVDLRTLDGSHCTSPGGTVIGHVYRGEESYRSNPSAPGVTMTFRDQDGNSHSVVSDRDGIYELQHLPAGMYTIDSHLGPDLYFAGGFSVRNGVCGEADVLIRQYDMSGRLLAGLGPHVTVKLAGFNSSEIWERADVQLDGRFYFKKIPDGEYLLAVESTLQAIGNDFYYPGTSDRHKAATIKVVNHKVAGSNEFNFDPRSLPYVPIRVALDMPGKSTFSWRLLLVTSDNIVYEERWQPDDKVAVLYGMRGQSYSVWLYGDPDYRTSHSLCVSDVARVTASPNLDVIHATAPAECR